MPLQRSNRFADILAIAVLCLPVFSWADSQDSLVLWYTEPARQWVEALPIGNGRLGAMVFGGIDQERLQLNEETLWAGGPYDSANPKGREALPEIRKLIFEGSYKQAAELASQTMMANPLGQMPYQTVGDLLLSFDTIDKVENYRRDLNLDTALASVSYTAEGTAYQREVFSTPVAQVIVIRLTADKPGKISFTASLKTPQQAQIENENSNTLVMRGVNGESQGIKGALKFTLRVRFFNQGGKLISANNTISAVNADSVTVLIAAATSYKNYADLSGDPETITKEQIEKASRKSWEALRNDHIQEHQRLFRRVQLDLGSTNEIANPTDRRIEKSDLLNDPQLAALYFQFGRYLLISCSRPGCQPANLQGIWNESMNPPWGSKYTININTEMNYWPAEPANLSECAQPLFAMIKDLSRTGIRTAQVTWGAEGWVAHHNTDLWRASAPIDGVFWGLWPTGGAWLCKHLWDHYEYTFDQDFLREYYPVMKESARFFLDTLVEEPKWKWLVTCPSLSPENGHPGGASICAGPTMDMQILRDLFSNCIAASEILGVDSDFRTQLAAVKDRLAPNQIGAAGQLQEWLEDWDLQAPDIHHRHVSHLYGLYPSSQINIYETPQLAQAARKSLEIRGDEATGWGLGWRLCLWARLHDGEHAYTILQMLLRPSRTYPNMFDAHPPFQIDGNFGGTAGICEMLLQSRLVGDRWEMEPLPALPKAWPDGSVKGLCARGGFIVDLQWQAGRLKTAAVHSIHGHPCQLRYDGTVHKLNINKAQTFMWNPS
ncbi:MAG TPA: glycoside hydrolase family 95 protein [Anaerohalosphaeraceae bacterium]|nr:glycoside hydrolase family 95 protein [Anaerohalosphaeraceae bacterium]